MDIKNKVRVRFAPSPTGMLHIGGVRTALFNYLFAKANGGDFILRIEDTDSDRFDPNAEKYIMDSMAWLGLEFDESPDNPNKAIGLYRQSERTELYKPFINKLLDDGHAYYAFDTKEELDTMRADMKAAGSYDAKYDYKVRNKMKNSLSLSADDVKARMDNGDSYVVRIKMPRTGTITLNDAIRGNITVGYNTIDDKVLMKSDGTPTYHLANVVDDYLMGISHVLRGDEWLPSLPLHIHLYNCLDLKDDTPIFAHLPLILNPDGKGKLSKRSGKRFDIPVYPMGFTDLEDGIFCKGFKDCGFEPSAVINHLALLGWNPKNDKEHFTLEGLVKEFKLDNVNKSPIRFDMAKAESFNKGHLQMMDNKDLANLLRPKFDIGYFSVMEDYIIDSIGLVKSRATFLDDIMVVGDYFFNAPKEYDVDLIKKHWKDNSKLYLNDIAFALDAINSWDIDSIHDAIENAMVPHGIPYTKVMGAVRLAITNFKFGPTMMEIMVHMDKAEVVHRLLYASNIIK
jgi:glutamyl-tRNA synthetase